MKKLVGEIHILNDHAHSVWNALIESGYSVETIPDEDEVIFEIYEELEEEPKKGVFDDMDNLINKFNKDLEEMLNDFTEKRES